MSIAPSIQPPEPSLEAVAALRGYTNYVHALQKQALAAGIPYGVVNGFGKLVFIHPDGTIRESDEPNSRIVA